MTGAASPAGMLSPAHCPTAAHGDQVSALDIDGLSKSYGHLTALDNLSLSVRQGEVFGLLGPNGSGKTTTIDLISGLARPTSGTVRVLGHDLRHDLRTIRRLVGMVPQETALYDELTAWANMDFHADLYGIPRSEKGQRIATFLELVQLLDRKDARVGTYSGGMKRRLALARALLHYPRLVYLDEPTLGVDVQARSAIWDHIRALRRQGKTILITTNYLEEAQALCDRLAIIDRGALVVVDTLAHLQKIYAPAVIDVVTAEPVSDGTSLEALSGVTGVVQHGTLLHITTDRAERLVPVIVQLLTRDGIVHSVTIRESNLNDIFLSLTGRTLRD